VKNVTEIPYPGRDHDTFEVEWLSHKNISEWWYSTGIVNDDAGAMYSYHIVIIKIKVMLVTIWSAQLACTDFSTGEHYFFMKNVRNGRNIKITDTSAVFGDVASVVKTERGMHMIGRADKFSFDLDMEYGKGAFWHCDDGFLLMGSPTTKESTYYYSYPNMPTNGTISIGNKTIKVEGKNWFDKQGGPFSVVSWKTHWEWFSFRFFDEEEIMFFAFPQGDYYDGTYIRKDKTSQRLNEYALDVKKVIEVNGMQFSAGWDVKMPGIKEEEYSVVPILEGQRNGMYFEVVSKVFNKVGDKVGYCVVELLPGVRNKRFVVKRS